MKRTIKILALPLIFIAGIGLGYVFFGNNQNLQDVSHYNSQVETNTTWTCAMHPQIRQNSRGDCPICGMELIPVEDSGDGDLMAHQLQMSEEAMRIAEIQTIIVEESKPIREISLLGKVKPDERLISSQTAHIQGRIEELYVNFTGQKVRKGEKLVSIYSPGLVTAQEELLEAMKYKESNESLFKAARKKLSLWKLTKEQIAEIEKSGKVRTEYDLIADYNGIVTNRRVNVGDHVKEGQVLFEITDLSKVWVLFEVYESDIPWIHLNDEISFRIQSMPGKEFSGIVTFIDPMVNPQSRVVNIRTELSNPGETLKPDMFANAVLKAALRSEVPSLMIPKSSVLWTGKRAVVYVRVPGKQKPVFEYREIILGPDAGDSYVVSKGLEAGEEVVVNGVFKIDAAAQLEGKKSMMNPDGVKSSAGHDHGAMNYADSEKKISADSNQKDPKMEGEHLSFHVSGNCEMCKKRIEGSIKGLEGIYTGIWDVELGMMKVQYDPEKITELEIHHMIAGVGHNTDKVKADEKTYEELPGCCQYGK